MSFHQCVYGYVFITIHFVSVKHYNSFAQISISIDSKASFQYC
jgi:hypothetical protein